MPTTYIKNSQGQFEKVVPKITTDTTLSQNGKPADAKAVGDALNAKADTTHDHDNATTSEAGFMSATDKTNLDNAMLKSGGTFTGEVAASSSYQTPTTSLLRNSKLSSTEATPSYNGEIVWVYE